MKRKIILILFIFIVLGGALYMQKNEILKRLYPKKYQEYVEYYSEKYGLDQNLVYSVIKAESKFDETAISKKGAKGLMQISDITKLWAIQELDLSEDIDIFSPEENIKIGCWYLKRLYIELGNDDLVIAAYNAGSGNVKKWLTNGECTYDGVNLSDIPFKETAAYLEKVKKNYQIYSEIYENYEI